MDNQPSESHTLGLEWLKSHASWELARLIFERFIMPPVWAWLISIGIARLMHSALSTAFNIFLMLLGIIGLIWSFGFMSKGRSEKAAKDHAGKLALQKLNELSRRSQWLDGQAPRTGNAGEGRFCQFWAEEVQAWSQATGKILWDNWGEDVARDFLGNVGLNNNENVGNVHPEAASAYRMLLHQIRTMQNIRRTLPT
ncbi:MAG: hypothetical protein LAP86_19555 [Acidobacteriia bacterium]|nr:hypothetical protein [Terriglobia bacterium]